MGTEVLRPQDVLIERIRVNPAVFQRRKGGHGNGSIKPGNYFNRKPLVRSSIDRLDQKKRFNGSPEPPTVSKRPSSSEDTRPSRSSNNYSANQNSHPQKANYINNLTIGQVTILRRGEPLGLLTSKDKNDKISSSSGKDAEGGLVLCGTNRLGPDPQMVPKQIRLTPAAGRSDVYAGSAAFSLSPSPRSLPLPSFFNKKQVSRASDDPATRDLRRLLRLDD